MTMTRSAMSCSWSARPRPGACPPTAPRLGSRATCLSQSRGRQSVTDALGSDSESLAAWGIDTSATTVEVRWVTWHSLASQVKAAAAMFVNADPLIERTIHRLANDVIDAVNVHSGAAN